MSDASDEVLSPPRAQRAGGLYRPAAMPPPGPPPEPPGAALIACSICRISVRTAPTVTMRIVQCGHTFCDVCLQAHMNHHVSAREREGADSDNEDDCECPVCRQPIEFYLHNHLVMQGLQRCRCAVCGELFGAERSPHVFNPCAHSVCSECVDTVHECPQCGVGVESTVKNYLGCQMIEQQHPRPPARRAPPVPEYVKNLVELHAHCQRYEDIMSLWDDLTIPNSLVPAEKHIYNTMMRLVQSSTVGGATSNDFMALGLPSFLVYPIERLRKKVDLCLQLRKTRPWSHGMAVSIFTPV